MSTLRFLPRAAVLCAVILAAPVGEARAAATPLRVVTTVPAVFSWVSEIGGSNVLVANVPGNGASPHDYQPRPSDERRLAEARLVLAIGPALDGWLGRGALAGAGSGRPKALVFLADSVPADRRMGDAAAPNPHFWLDPSLAAVLAGTVGAAMEERADEPGRAALADGALRCRAALTALDDELNRTLAPVRGRTVVCYHDAFAYFLRRYGIEVAGVVAEGPERAPGPRRIAGLLAAARSRNARAMIVEEGDDQRLARRLAADLGIPVVELDAVESGTPAAGRYAGALRAAGAALAKALN